MNNNDHTIKSVKEFNVGEEKLNQNDEIRKNLMDDEIKFSSTIEQINITDLVEIDESINYFSLPDNEEFLDLTYSIEHFGIINPLIVMKDEASGKYTIIDGRSRFMATRALYSNSKDERFLKVPCILLDNSTDPLLIQGLVITSNINYRKLAKETLIKSVLLLDEILKKTKKNRNDMNITDIIAKRTGVSRTTVNNYRQLKKLSKTSMYLLNQGYIGMGVARLLTTVEPEKQDKIITGLGKDINQTHKVKCMLGPLAKGVKVATGEIVPETWEMKVENARISAPPFTNVMLRLDSAALEDCLIGVMIGRKNYALKNMGTYPGDNSNQFCKITVNDEHMEQYINKGFLSQEVYDKLKAHKLHEIVKIG